MQRNKFEKISLCKIKVLNFNYENKNIFFNPATNSDFINWFEFNTFYKTAQRDIGSWLTVHSSLRYLDLGLKIYKYYQLIVFMICKNIVIYIYIIKLFAHI